MNIFLNRRSPFVDIFEKCLLFSMNHFMYLRLRDRDFLGYLIYVTLIFSLTLRTPPAVGEVPVVTLDLHSQGIPSTLADLAKKQSLFIFTC